MCIDLCGLEREGVRPSPKTQFASRNGWTAYNYASEFHIDNITLEILLEPMQLSPKGLSMQPPVGCNFLEMPNVESLSVKYELLIMLESRTLCYYVGWCPSLA